MNVPLDIKFPICGPRLPVDNGYPLYATISKVLGSHLVEGVGVFPVRSRCMKGDSMFLDETSSLCLRTTPEYIPDLISLAGSSLKIDNHMIQIGVPSIFPVQPTKRLYSRFVTCKNSFTPEKLIATCSQLLSSQGINAKVSVPRTKDGFPQRRTIGIKGVRIIGFGLLVDGLTPFDSLHLLVNGLGGRRHMGGGLFQPVKT